MTASRRVDPMDDIAKQARQGSVAAIIQVLNEELAPQGVRSRAVFEEGKLQLLCEAATPEQLTQSELVPQVQQILERLAPRKIRRVIINSRIVREQQLLWLEEINRDRENQLLWSEEINLRTPNPFKRWWEDQKTSAATPRRKSADLSFPSRSRSRNNQQFQRGILGGVALAVLVLLGGWAVLNSGMFQRLLASKEPVPPPPANPNRVPSTASTPTPLTSNEPFNEAVRLAQQAAEAGRTAQSSAQWLDIAAQWQRASDLMSRVSPSHPRYGVAQERIALYRQNSEAAQQEAVKRR